MSDLPCTNFKEYSIHAWFLIRFQTMNKTTESNLFSQITNHEQWACMIVHKLLKWDRSMRMRKLKGTKSETQLFLFKEKKERKKKIRNNWTRIRTKCKCSGMNQFNRSCLVKSFDSDCDISSYANLPVCLPAWQMQNKALNHENVSGKRKTLKMKEEQKKATKIENSNTRKLNLISVVNVL